MLWSMSLILIALWTLGVASGASLGLWVHLLLIAGLLAAVAAAALVYAASQRGVRASNLSAANPLDEE
jgi:hypothetical protein